MRLLLVGINHRTAPLEFRERLVIDPSKLAEANRSLLRVPGVREAIILSTCSRTEVAACYDAGTPELSEFLAEYFGIALAQLKDHIYEYSGIDAAHHLFRVTCSLDSPIIGESQILGQVKTAYRAARSIGAIQSNLERLMQSSFSIAKQVRRGTKIGNGSVSMASVATSVIEDLVGPLRDRRILLIGAGEIGSLVGSYLKTRGASSVLIANRTFGNAVNLATRLGGHALRFEHISIEAVNVDAIITATSFSQFIFRSEDGAALMRARENRPLLFMDLAVPRNVDPDINLINGISVYDVDTLRAVVSSRSEDRNRELAKAEEIVAQSVNRYRERSMTIEVAPAIRGLQAAVETIVHNELRQNQPRLLTLAPDQKNAIELLSRGISHKLLHPVIRRLKHAAVRGDIETMETICAMFDFTPRHQTQQYGTRDRRSVQQGTP